MVKWTERLKGKQSEIKTDIERKIWDRRGFFSPLSFPVKNLIKGKLDPRAGEIWRAKWRGCRIQREWRRGEVLCKRPLFIEGEQDLAR